MKKIIISVVGYSGSGKSTFSEIANQKYGIPVIATGPFVRQEVTRRGLDLTQKNIELVSSWTRTETGGVFIRALRYQIDDALKDKNIALIDSLREMNDYVELSSDFFSGMNGSYETSCLLM
jgi:dephospho-CoA kinase